jgi:fatty acid synthase subunit beta
MHEHSQLCEEADFRKSEGEAVDNEYLSSRVADIEGMPLPCTERLKVQMPTFTPVWGLSKDDITSRLSHSLATSMSEPSTLSAIRQACCLRLSLLKSLLSSRRRLRSRT